MYRYKHIIWDWNGTLVNDTWLSVSVINKVLAKYKKPQITIDTYHEIFDFPVKNYYKRLGFDFNQTPFEIIGTEFINGYNSRWQECRLHDTARDILEKLRSLGIKQSILSAADISMLKRWVQFYNLEGYFTEINGLNHHYASGKKELALTFLQKSDIDPGRTLLIGDTTHDFLVASHIGVHCILFTQGHHPREKLMKCRVPLLDNLGDILIHI
ncbi:HAD family hydrolase [candidate division KSB1 bacterium]|nr:HAD family hydrolase [candidate division KSB1 bacterium]